MSFNVRPAGDSDFDDSDEEEWYISSVGSKKDRNQARRLNNLGNNNADENWDVVEVKPTERARLAVINGDKETISKLLEDNLIGVDGQIGPDKWSMLIFAAQAVNPTMIKFLLEKGAYSNFRGSGGFTPILALAYVTKEGSNISDDVFLECLSILVEAGANVELRDKNQLTALHMAAQSGNLCLVSKFLELGIDKSSVDVHGRTPLHFAALHGRGRIVRHLVLADCDVSLVDEDGLKPCDLANENEFSTIANVLYDVESTHWLPGKDPTLLEIEREIKPSEYMQKKEEGFVIPQRNQIEMILGQLNLAHFMPLFNEHKIDYITFLRLHESHLEEMGISQPEDRLKISESIRAANNQDWKKSSIQPVFMQAAITMPEVVCILSNIKAHMSYVTSRLKHLENKIREEPQMLIVESESTTVQKHSQQIDVILMSIQEFISAATIFEYLWAEDGKAESKPGDKVQLTPRSKNGWYITCACCFLGLAYISVKGTPSYAKLPVSSRLI